MAAIADERRTKPRFSLRLPVEVLLPDSPRITGITKNVSLSGVYFVSPCEFQPPQEMQFLLDFPPEITLSSTKKVECTGRVVRVDRTGDLGTGIAVKIESHQMLDRSDSSYPFAMVRTPSTL